MFSFEVSRNTQRVICMLVATVIVTASFAYGAIKAQPEAHKGYTVTIVQLPGAELPSE
jgi:hypothetical protein